MNNPTESIECLTFLRDAFAFACFMRVWWDGASVDGVIWWKDRTGCYQRIYYTGESLVTKTPRLLAENKISESELLTIIGTFDASGLSEIHPIADKIAYTHYDHWFGIKHENVHGVWLGIPGGKHADLRVAAFTQRLIDYCPEMKLKP